MQRTIMLTFAGLAVGLALGYVLFHSTSPSAVASNAREPTRSPTGAPAGDDAINTVVTGNASTTRNGTRDAATELNEAREATESTPQSPSVQTVKAPQNMQCSDVLSVCENDKRMLQERINARDESKPIAPRSDVPPRLSGQGLVQTFNKAFVETKIPGAVVSVDCTEHPCILFGRLNGDEELVAQLESAKAFQPLHKDVGVMLSWAQTIEGGHHDDGHHDDGEGQKPDENVLFAFAFYEQADRTQYPDIDKRIRLRTAEFWNAMRPDE